MSDLQRALAFCYRRKGVDAMPGADLRMLLAYDLRWFAPEDAKRVVQRAVASGLLVERDGTLSPSFDVQAVQIPMNFRPSVDIADAPPVDLAAPPAPPRAPDPVGDAAEDERRRRGLFLRADVARLVVRRRQGEDVKAEAAALEATLLRS